MNNRFSDVDPSLDERHPPSLGMTLGLAAMGGVLAWYALRKYEEGNTYYYVDSAPEHTARGLSWRGDAPIGRTVTIDRPRAEIYAFWLDFKNLPSFMENIRDVAITGPQTARWSIAAPFGQSVSIETRLVEEREGELLAWESLPGSDIDAHGIVLFRDAPGDRGTEVEAIVSYRPPGGAAGRLVATLFQKEPAIQGRRELKRLKMLLEAGEIATSANRRTDEEEH